MSDDSGGSDARIFSEQQVTQAEREYERHCHPGDERDAGPYETRAQLIEMLEESHPGFASVVLVGVFVVVGKAVRCRHFRPSWFAPEAGAEEILCCSAFFCALCGW